MNHLIELARLRGGGSGAHASKLMIGGSRPTPETRKRFLPKDDGAEDRKRLDRFLKRREISRQAEREMDGYPDKEIFKEIMRRLRKNDA